MGKKVEKGMKNEKNQSATSQDDVDSNKALEPHVCTGNFQADFNELCRRANMTYIPPIVARPKPPAPSSQQDASPTKGGKDKGKQAAPEPEPEEVQEDTEPEPKTFTTKDKFEYFKPCTQVEMDHPDKGDTVTEVFIRGWKIDAPMMDIFKQCWPTMEKLHTVNLWNTGLDSTTLHTLSTFLPQCQNIRNVTLDGNVAEEENWYELVTEESLIQNLSLRHCGITDKGATMIGRCLGSAKRCNVKLLSLNLSNNKIGDEGLEQIAQGLRMNRTLLSLSLASNQIGDKGTKKLAQVLSKFPLTHEEVVERRRQKLDQPSPDRNASPLNRRGAESRDRPGSQRSVIHADKGKKADKAPPKAKKDGKKDEKEEKHDKGKGGKKEKEEKGAAKKDAKNKASIAADAGKGGKNPKAGRGGKDKAKPATAEHEVSDSPEFINPLLEGGDFKNGQLEVNGNRVLINVNLARNQITEVGLWAFFEAIEHQTKLALSSNRSSGTGLMRLLVGKNKVSNNHDVLQKLNEIMLPKDPFYKPPPLTPEVES